MPYDIETIRKNIKKAVSGKHVDPDEFRPDKAKDSANPLKYRFFVLPPLKSGDVLKSGTVTQSMENFFIAHGDHWVNDRPHPCPRVWDGSDCDICNYGFELYKECKEKKLGDDRKKQIGQQWMPNTYYMVNIFFTNWKGNPEDLRGKVKYYNAPKTCLDKWMATLMRDDMGDSEDPDAYGVFFDENAAFCFELVAAKEGRNNGYKSSAFIKNNGIPVPMIMNEDRTPNKKQIEQLLKLRIDLFSKIELPDLAKISKLANVMINGDDGDTNNHNGGFDADETAIEAPEAEVTKKGQEKAPAASVATEAKKTGKPVQARTDAKKTVGKPTQPNDDDDIVTQLANESPLSDDSETSSESSNKDDDIDGDDIASLLSQLDE